MPYPPPEGEREVGVDKRSFPLPSGIGRNLTELEMKEGKINNGWSPAVHMPAVVRPYMQQNAAQQVHER